MFHNFTQKGFFCLTNECNDEKIFLPLSLEVVSHHVRLHLITGLFSAFLPVTPTHYIPSLIPSINLLFRTKTPKIPIEEFFKYCFVHMYLMEGDWSVFFKLATCLYILEQSKVHFGDNPTPLPTDLWWRWGRGCSQPPRWKTWRLRRRASWRRTRRRRAWARQCDCCSCCCASSWQGSDPSRWGRARSGPGGDWRTWRCHLRAGAWANSCPLYSSRNPSSSLREEWQDNEGWMGGATGRLRARDMDNMPRVLKAVATVKSSLNNYLKMWSQLQS